MFIKNIVKKILTDEIIFKKNAKYTMMKIQKYQTLCEADRKKIISEEYQRLTGNILSWDNPKRYTEKLNVSKLLCSTPLKQKLADKYLVREWIKQIIGEEYLIPLLGVYDKFEEIDFDKLPDKFVIKCNHDSGSVSLCDKKKGINMKFLKEKYNYYLKRNLADLNFEMHYADIKPKILIERYMGENITDYKFICIEGQPYYCRVDTDRFTDHKRVIYDMKWKKQSFRIGNYEASAVVIKKPEKFELMKTIVLKLCKDIDQVRVDLYEINGRIYFGEMTFTSDNGMDKIYPDEYDFELGNLWNLKL